MAKIIKLWRMLTKKIQYVMDNNPSLPFRVTFLLLIILSTRMDRRKCATFIVD